MSGIMLAVRWWQPSLTAANDPKPSQPPLDSGRSTEGKRTINRLGESGHPGAATQRSRTVTDMTSASWSRITRREDHPTMGRLSSAMVRGMSLCPYNELNRHSGRFNGHCLGLYRHSAIEPTPVSANSKFGVRVGQSVPQHRGENDETNLPGAIFECCA